MTSRRFLDSRWTDALSFLFWSTCTFERSTKTKSTAHEGISSWTPITGFVDLPCNCAAAPTVGVGGEVKSASEIYVSTEFTVSVPKDLTGITEADRVVVTGTNGGTFDIVLVVTGTQGILSRVSVRRIR